MIQRKQTIFLLLALAVSSLLFFIPIALITANGQNLILKISEIHDTNNGVNTMPDLVLLSIICLISCITILLYKNRTFQLRLCIANILLSAALEGLMFFQLINIHAIDGTIKYGLFFPILIIIFQILAFIGIRKDDKLVKSLDRIR